SDLLHDGPVLQWVVLERQAVPVGFDTQGKRPGVAIERLPLGREGQTCPLKYLRTNLFVPTFAMCVPCGWRKDSPKMGGPRVIHMQPSRPVVIPRSDRIRTSTRRPRSPVRGRECSSERSRSAF